MSQYYNQALFLLYPQIITLVGDVAYDANGNVVTYDPVLVEAESKKLECSAQAKNLLSLTDWTSISDVADPLKSNPYLLNQADFVAYRSTIRGYAVNPVENPTFPTMPTEQWSS